MRTLSVPLGLPHRHRDPFQDGPRRLSQVQKSLLEQTKENKPAAEKQAAPWNKKRVGREIVSS